MKLDTRNYSWALTQKPKVKKPQDKYEGLNQCFRNVRPTNMAGKPTYCTN